MSTLLAAVLSFVGFIVAYHTYGRWLSRRIFGLDPKAEVPSEQLRDDVDFVPTNRQVIFGHHFTSIAGTGPIVGPAIAVFWGWLPALLWVVFGSIFIGAVHDFGALIVSIRNRGQTVGEVAGRMIAPRAKVLFLLILFFALSIVLAIFGLVIASIFSIYPSSILPVWISMPIAIAVGLWCRKKSHSILWPSIIALVVVYFSIWIGSTFITSAPWQSGPMEKYSVVIWTVLLFAYCFAASVLPVWVLLQPRDFINSHQLLVALGLLLIGLVFASITGKADLATSAPALAKEVPVGAPPIWPFLFITIACGAVSGFHCLVSSGTSSKQIEKETDAQYVGYGAMLLEGALAVIVILACCAGVGMGQFSKQPLAEGSSRVEWQPVMSAVDSSQPISGREAWDARYSTSGKWSEFSLGKKVGAFVEGGANFLAAIGIPLQLGITIIAVLVASFAATTLDTATRLQRYVIQELATSLYIKPLENKYAATTLAVTVGGTIAMIPSVPGGNLGTGGLLLWPLFGATNQLLAGLAFLVTVFYLWRRGKPIYFAVIPMIIMLIMPAWALLHQLFSESGFLASGKYVLFTFGLGIMGLQIWMIVEAIIAWPRAKGVLEETLPPLPSRKLKPNVDSGAGRSC